jgi:hypothetical protein
MKITLTVDNGERKITEGMVVIDGQVVNPGTTTVLRGPDVAERDKIIRECIEVVKNAHHAVVVGPNWGSNSCCLATAKEVSLTVRNRAVSSLEAMLFEEENP